MLVRCGTRHCRSSLWFRYLEVNAGIISQTTAKGDCNDRGLGFYRRLHCSGGSKAFAFLSTKATSYLFILGQQNDAFIVALSWLQAADIQLRPGNRSYRIYLAPANIASVRMRERLSKHRREKRAPRGAGRGLASKSWQGYAGVLGLVHRPQTNRKSSGSQSPVRQAPSASLRSPPGQKSTISQPKSRPLKNSIFPPPAHNHPTALRIHTFLVLRAQFPSVLCLLQASKLIPTDIMREIVSSSRPPGSPLFTPRYLGDPGRVRTQCP